MHIALHIIFLFLLYFIIVGADVGTGIATMINDKTKRQWPKDDKGNIIGNKKGEFAAWIDYQAYRKGIL